jgi:hypothetical protein
MTVRAGAIMMTVRVGATSMTAQVGDVVGDVGGAD